MAQLRATRNGRFNLKVAFPPYGNASALTATIGLRRREARLGSEGCFHVPGQTGHGAIRPSLKPKPPSQEPAPACVRILSVRLSADENIITDALDAVLLDVLETVLKAGVSR